MKKILQPLALFPFLLAACSQPQSAASVENQGKVKQETIAVAPKLPGRILKIFVSEGEQVHRGDTLAVLDVPEIGARLQQAEGAIVSAEGQFQLAKNGATAEQLDQLQGQLDAATAQLQFAAESFRRMNAMFQDSLVSAQQFDEVRSKYRAAEAQVKAIEARKLEVQKGTRPETIKAARGQVERALGAKAEVLQAQTERYILAPADMQIESISLKQGELATPGYTVFNGYQTGSTYFRFTVSESKINAFAVNAPVRVKVPNTEREIAARVASIKQLPRYADNTSTAPTYKLGESVFELKVVPNVLADAAGLFANSTILLAENAKQASAR